MFSRAWVSAKLIPARLTRTRTWPSAGSGTGASSTSSSTSGPPNAEIVTARIAGRTLPCRASCRSPSSDPSPLTPSRPSQAAATGCWVAPRCTSRSRPRSSTTRAWSARSATTSATPSTRRCTRAASSPTTSSTCPGGKTFFWAGRYERDVNIRHTLQTDLNVFEHFQPSLSEASAAADVVFLANIQPDLQREVREQCANARFVALDSMNLWIDIAHESLMRTIRGVDGVILNDGELKQLTDEPNLVRAARAVLDLGPSVVVAKQGEYGSALFTRDGYFALPAYPTPDVVDPTGAGDTFAGGFMGYIAAHPDEAVDEPLLRRAMAYGTVLASFNVEAFGPERMLTLTREEIAERVAELHRSTSFDDAPVALR